MKKRICSIFLTIVIIVATLIPSFVVSAAQPLSAQYTPSFDKTSGYPASDTTFTISMQLSEPAAINGMNYVIEFDENYLKYVSGTAAVKHSAFSDATVYYAGSGKIGFIWTSESDVIMPKNFQILSVKFKVADNATLGSTSVKVKMIELYQSSIVAGELRITSLDFAENRQALFTVTELDDEIKSVIALIDAIGTVTSTTECKQKIDSAREAYNRLSSTQKTSVNNYATLEKAELDYEIAEYKTANKTAVELDTNKINNTKDKEALLKKVDDAIAAYKNLSVAARVALLNTKDDLWAYKALIEKLLSDAAEQAKQEQYNKEAQDYIKSFKKDHAYTLTLTPETVKSYDSELVSKADNEYKGLIEIPNVGIYIKEGLKKESALIDKLKDKLSQISASQNPEKSEEVLAAENWKNQFASVLGLTPDDVTYDDSFDIQLAKLTLDMMNEDVVALLAKEKALIEKLYEVAIKLTPEEEIITDKEVIVEEVIVEVEKPVGSNMDLTIKNRQIGPFVWILVGIASLSTLIFVALRITWYLAVVKGGKKR